VTKKDAWQAYMRAVIRAQDSRHLLSWSGLDLLQAYIVASVPGCTFSEFCEHLEIKVDEPAQQAPEPPKTDEEANADAIAELSSLSNSGLPISVKEN
jgi:hypothetical protein